MTCSTSPKHIISICVIIAIVCVESSQACATTEFTCGNGNCISLSLVNNSVNDCGDNYDEGYGNSCAKASAFKCNSGTCIPTMFYLDNSCDCPACEDEAKTIGSKCLTNSTFLCNSSTGAPAGVANSECRAGICRCLFGWKSNDLGNACSKRQFGDPCDVDIDCTPVISNSFCNGTCMCQPGYRFINESTGCVLTPPSTTISTSTTTTTPPTTTITVLIPSTPPSTTTTTMTLPTTTFTVPPPSGCAWVPTDNSNSPGGSANNAMSLGQCQSNCINQPSGCQYGFDWNPSNPAGNQCFLSNYPTVNVGTFPGVVHYQLLCATRSSSTATTITFTNTTTTSPPPTTISVIPPSAIGIGIGVGAGLCIIVVIIVLYLFIKHRRSKSRKEDPSVYCADPLGDAELPYTSAFSVLDDSTQKGHGTQQYEVLSAAVDPPQQIYDKLHVVPDVYDTTLNADTSIGENMYDELE